MAQQFLSYIHKRDVTHLYKAGEPACHNTSNMLPFQCTALFHADLALPLPNTPQIHHESSLTRRGVGKEDKEEELVRSFYF